MPLLNFPMNVIPPNITKAQALSTEAARLVAGPDMDMADMFQAIRLLAEANKLLIGELVK